MVSLRILVANSRNRADLRIVADLAIIVCQNAVKSTANAAGRADCSQLVAQGVTAIDVAAFPTL